MVRTVTVQGLIELLAQYPRDLPVTIDAFTYQREEWPNLSHSKQYAIDEDDIGLFADENGDRWVRI